MITLKHPSYTSIEQGNMLINLGVPVNSADMYYYVSKDNIPDSRPFYREKECLRDTFFKELSYKPGQNYVIPCWSAIRLIEIFDTCIIKDGHGLNNYWANTKEYIDYIRYIIDCFNLNKNNLDFSKLNN